VGLKLNGTHQLLLYTDVLNLLGDNIDAIKKNTETLIEGSKEFGQEVNAKKTMYMLLSSHQNAGQNHYIKIANICFENLTYFKYISNDISKSIFDSGGNLEENEFG
jgi:hypothetical protein